jgi:hypothetical protein
MEASRRVLQSLCELVNEDGHHERMRFTSALSNGRDLYAFRFAENDTANTLYFREDGERLIALKKSGVIPDESYIWWAIRSSSRHPTLELRAPDVCTLVEDAIAIASLYRTLARHLYERPGLLKPIGVVERAIAVENKWRAQRYGTGCIFASQDGPVEIRDLLSSLIKQLSDDASATAPNQVGPRSPPWQEAII